LHPNAVIVAVEPDEIPLKRLRHNAQDLRIFVEVVALGDGKPRYRLLKDRIGRTMFSPTPTKDYVLASTRLSNIFDKYNGDFSKKYYIKVDCEGGEQWLVDHAPTEDILLNAAGIGMKLHFPSDHPQSPRWYNEPWVKPWEFYYEWWTRLFTNHKISYERSSKKTGYGHLLIDNKNYDWMIDESLR
jgi:hypothetical protein